MFANAIPNHTLRLIPDADHNFKGKYEEVVNVILEYFELHEKDAFEKGNTNVDASQPHISKKWSAKNMGQHVSLCMPRWIDVEGVKNFRDLGGWPLRDGSGYIRERFIFRCGQ